LEIDASTPAVVLFSARHGGLGITRTLGRLGVPVYNVDVGSLVPAFKSRYSKGKFLWDVEDRTPQESLEFLAGLARKIGRRAVLIPSSDATAMFVADHEKELSEWYAFPKLDAKLARGLASKKEMYFLAKKLGIATAETAFPQSREEVLSYLETAKFPIMLKGIFGTRLGASAGKRMFIVRDRAELLRLYDAYEDQAEPNFMLQEYIPGGDDTVWMFNGYFNKDSDCLVGFTGKKIRQYPVYTGFTSLGICLPCEVVDQTTRRFMKAVGYRGILDIGYRFDARDGQYKVLDINPRVGATFRLFVGKNGIDVVRAMYLDITGQKVEAAPAPEGRRWIVEDCDLISSFRYMRDGKMGLLEWLKSHKGIEETAIFALDDPLPALWMGFRNLQIGVRSTMRGKNGQNPQPARAASALLPAK
jgi:D-aspartate ligase